MSQGIGNLQYDANDKSNKRFEFIGSSLQALSGSDNTRAIRGIVVVLQSSGVEQLGMGTC